MSSSDVDWMFEQAFEMEGFGMSDTTQLTLREREKLRNSERRKVVHAIDVLTNYIKWHMREDLAERHIQELYLMKTQLLLLIQNQHIKDADYAKYKTKQDLGQGAGKYNADKLNSGDF